MSNQEHPENPKSQAEQMSNESEAQVDEAQAQSAETEDSADAAELNELELRLEQTEQRAAEANEKAIRAVAEMENIRRRAVQDVEKAHKFALEKFAGELLTTVDNLERALQLAGNADDSNKSFIEGIELTYKGLVSTLEKFQVNAVGEIGDAFNPDLHQAMSMQPTNEHPHNTVMAVMQKGYTINGRLLRPAMVMVARNEGGGVDTEA